MIDSDRFLRELINKKIDVAFANRGYRLSVSHGLFSSNSLDSGTASLLRLVERSIDLSGVHSVIDLGCGTGALGLPVAVATSAHLLATDRDALAAWFTRQNGMDLGLDSCETSCGLGTGAAASGRFSLALSNLPAKAGDPVLRQLIGSLSLAAGSDGICGAVIVRPLHQTLVSHLAHIGASIEHQKITANHVAVLWTNGDLQQPAPATSGQADLSPYIRGTATFNGPKLPYAASTAHGLPDFDNLSFRILLCFRFLHGVHLGGRVVIYGAGQGHVPLGCRQCGATDLIVADRDALGIAITAFNLGGDTQSMLVPTLASAAAQLESQSVDWLIVDDDPIPGSLWLEEIRDTAHHVLSRVGKLLVICRSTASVRLEQILGAEFRRIDARKQKGYRVALWKRIDIGNRS